LAEPAGEYKSSNQDAGSGVVNGKAQAVNDNVRGVTGKQPPFTPQVPPLLYIGMEIDK